MLTLQFPNIYKHTLCEKKGGVKEMDDEDIKKNVEKIRKIENKKEVK